MENNKTQPKIRLSWKSFYKRHSQGIVSFLILLVPIGWWLLTSGFQIIFGISLGFLDWKGISGNPQFAGIDNYIRFFTDSFYYLSLLRTLLIGGLCFVVNTVFGLLAAILLNQATFCKGLFRTVWYIPVVMATVASSQIFKVFIDPYDGMINQMLISMGCEPIIWDMSVPWSIAWIVIYSTWKGLGASVLLWLAALQSVDKSIVEAAEIDGAGTLTLFFHIKIPQMMPIITFILINGFIGSMQIYEQVLFITDGGPYGKTEVLAYRIMRDAFWENNFGMAGASSMVMMLITFFFSLIIFRRQKRGI